MQAYSIYILNTKCMIFFLKIPVSEKEIVKKMLSFMLTGYSIGKIELLIWESGRRSDTERVFILYRQYPLQFSG